ncbi:cytochrome P450 6a2-like [Anoplophora glabripennis]|uniref:cytochrome P450 6a2-like n=1 Tax=Anoplophora glabripennis TaxID=217634 RepID=UPI0008742A16|nr:cytochrome P450 6a2-like [Anoplophora glabripennis]
MTLLTSSFLVDCVGFVVAIITVVYAYFVWALQYWKRRNIPYVEPVIPWGNLENPSKRTMFIGDRFREIYRQARWKYCGMFGMTRPMFVVLNLDLVKQVMTKDFHNFVDRGFYTNEKDDPLSCHLFAIGGTKWRNLRTKFTPTFTSGKMKAMFGSVLKCGTVMEKYLEEQVGNKEGVDFKTVLGNYTTDVIGSCAFGLNCNSFKDPDSSFRQYAAKVLERSRFGNLKQAFCFNFPHISALLGLRMLPKDVSDFFLKVIYDTVGYREKNSDTRDDFLQLLINIKNNKDAQASGYQGDGKTLTMDEVAAQSFVFFIAGYETSSITMTFALFELATHQNIQEKVREEIERVLAKYSGEITYDSLGELKYLKQVIDETLRMYSPCSFVTRICAQDYKVPGEQAVIEKGTMVIIPIRGIHHDEEYYENPSEFDPDRFTEENKAARHPYAHIPFGEGPRICIGERFGIMQTKLGLAKILRNFRLTLNKKTKVPLAYSLVSVVPSVKGGMWLNLEKL